MVTNTFRVSLIVLISMGSLAAQSVSTSFGNNGLTSLQYNGVQYLNSGAFVVNQVILTDSSGNQSNGSLSVSTSVNAAAGQVTQTYAWGTVQITYAPSGNRLNLSITTTNNSPDTITGLFYDVFNLQFPSAVQEYDGVDPMVDSNIGAPTVLSMTSTAGVMVLTNNDVVNPLMAGFPWSLNSPTNTIFPLLVNTNQNSMYPTFWPFINRPIAPGASDQYNLSLRFGPSGSTDQSLAGDIYQAFGAAFPPQFSWPDRHPIGMLVLATSDTGWATNPRGWLLDPTIDVFTPDGLAAFQSRILAWANQSVQILQQANAQGMITWDIEGEQFPQPTTYVCDPTQFLATAPEMANVADAYFQVFRNAGLRVGVCVRPQQFVLGPGGTTASQNVVATDQDMAALLIEKINYAKNRWGATMFYIDSNGGPGNPMDPSVMQAVSAAEPDVLLVPEQSDPQYYAYSAPYLQLTNGYDATPPEARLIYPNAFSVINVADGPLSQDFQTLVNSVAAGDALMLRGWFNDGSLSWVQQIYQQAGSGTSQPPVVSILSPASGSTLAGTVTVSASAGGGAAISSVQFALDGSSLGSPAAAAPYTATLNTTAFANGGHTLAATATDTLGRTAVASIPVTISNVVAPPEVSIVSPASGSTLAGTVTVSASASGGAAISSVQFALDGSSLGSPAVAAPYTATLNTTAFANGSHTLAATATDTLGRTAVASIPVTISNPVTPPPAASCPAPASDAFTGCYYSGEDFNSFVFTRTDPTINFNWSGTGPEGPAPLGPDDYSVRWQGNFQFQGGTYQFTLNTADGDILYIDGQTIYSNWTDHGAVPVTVNDTLTAGVHLVELDYFKDVGSAEAQLSWVLTAAAAPAVAPPAVSISAPANGATVSGAITVTATATSQVGIASVQLLLDGASLGAPISAAPYSYQLNTSTLANGAHTIAATAMDTAGNSTLSANVTITVNNAIPPSVSISAPANGATVSGTVTLTAAAASQLGIASVQFLLDGAGLGQPITTAPYSYQLNTTTLANGAHTIAATANDTAGNSATSAAVTFTVSNTAVAPPTVSMSAPANGATVSGTIALTAAAASQLGIASVQFLVDGAGVGAAVTTAPYSYQLDTTTLVNGAHTIAAAATDTAGNTTTSASISITVDNTTAPAACAVPGVNVFTGCYYSGENFNTFVFLRTDPMINFNWAGTGPQGPVALGPDDYSVRWIGNFQFVQGTYQFTVNTADGDVLYVDGQVVYSNWQDHGAVPVTVNVNLTAGTHTIRLDYYQDWGSAEAQLSWVVQP